MGLAESRSDWDLDKNDPESNKQWEFLGSWRLDQLTEEELLERMRAKPVQTRFLPPHIKKFVKQTGDVKTVSMVKEAPEGLSIYVWSTSDPGAKDRYHSTGWEDGRPHPVFIGSHFSARDMHKNLKYEIGRWEVKQKAKAIPHEVGGKDSIDVGKLPSNIKLYLGHQLKDATASRQVATPKGMLAYTWEKPVKGKMSYFAAVWKGRGKKPAVYSRFNTEKRRDQKVDDEIRFWKEKQAGKAKAAADKKAFTHDYKVGDILYASWGYDQTNVNFYQVVEVPSGKTIKIREIGQQVVKNDGHGSSKVTATKGIFIGKVLTKRVRTNGSVKINQSFSAYKWDGKPKLSDTGYAGH